MISIFEKPWNYRDPIGDTEIYTHYENGVLEICYMGSNDLKKSWKDWAYNFAFWRWFRRDKNGKIFVVHWGLYKKWLLIKPYVYNLIKKTNPEKIIVIGYSQGAGESTYTHRDVFEELGIEPYTVIAGSPKCFGLIGLKRQRELCKNIISYQNGNDAVTKVPFFMHHVGKIIYTGKRQLFKLSIKDHFLENYKDVKLC